MGILEDKIKQKQAQVSFQKPVVTVQTVKAEPKTVRQVVKKTKNEYVEEINEKIAEKFRGEISSTGMTEDVTAKIKAEVKRECALLDTDYNTKADIEKTVIMGIVGLGPVESYMNDEDVTEILVQRFDNICIEKNGKIQKINEKFVNEAHLQTVIQRIVQPVGRQINLFSPIVDARLKDGSRVNATLPPISPDGATLTIRKFSNKALSGDDYVRLGAMSESMLSFLQACVKSRVNIIISGGTNTGKTTLLNMLSNAIPKDEMIITIEDSCELKLQTENVRRFETRETDADSGMKKIDVKALVKASLRMRPDRIIIGEIRDDTIIDMINAMSTGHEGSLCTVHANSPLNLINTRLPMLYNNYCSAQSQALQISEALDLIVQVGFEDGKRKITYITAIDKRLDDGKVKLNNIFVYEKESGFIPTGYVPKGLLRQMKRHHIYYDENNFLKV